MKKLARIAATASLVIGLGAPGVVAASTGSINTTGPDSTNEVNVNKETTHDVENDNDVDANLDTDQDANSGSVDVTHNTTADGDAESGMAENESNVSGSIHIDNGNSSMGGSMGGSDSFTGTIDKTGPDSTNEVNYNNVIEVTVNNDNDIDFDNDVDQDATSGDVTVDSNTHAGGGRSGDVRNSSNTEFTFEIVN